MDAEKLNKSVSEFEETVKKMKALKDVYEKIEYSNNKLNEIYIHMQEVLEIQETFISDSNRNFTSFSKEFNNSMNTFFDMQRNYQAELNTEIEQMQEDSQNKIREFIDEYHATFRKFDENVSRMMRMISEEQREYQLQLNSKLERISSDIQVEVRNNSKSVEENLASRTNKLSDEISALNTKVETLHKRQFIMTGILIVLSLLSIALPFIK